ncbi:MULTISPECIES: hypothetical protein [unclassified Dietzia]|uniref:hypothetical protein n=1 Tax=unclassified Dietzia TaxID=2617939 RepID=UPI0015FB9EC8|nr:MULTISPECIES: hypothetical protein [unclassified Dietzia]MBB1022966.1 hypothetical protein [Dietzia sp. DQ12-76]MBB1026472.1 hypothetical protein [Dietzia sp. DQ11-38-2]
MTTTTAKKTAARKTPAKKSTKPAAPKATVKTPAPTPAEVDAKASDDAVEDTSDDGRATITIEIEINGTEIELELPATFNDADPDAIVYMEEEKPTAAFKALIGVENWATLKQLRWTARDFREVIDAWKGAVGLGNG